MEMLEYKSVCNSNSLTELFDVNLSSVNVDKPKMGSQAYLSKVCIINHNSTLEKRGIIRGKRL
jgi:hypothetical protein